MKSALIQADIFEAARLGDQKAILKLLEITQPDIRRYARATCHTSADAEDATQETLWLLFRHIGTVRSLLSFSGWLFSIVRRQCLRLARSAGITVSSEEQEDIDIILHNRPNSELRLDIAAAFEALPLHYRDIVLMRDVREMTINEIALALGITRQAVKARLHRARLFLREYLTQ